MKRKHRIWPWIITLSSLLLLGAAALHLVPRWQLHTYKQTLRAQGFPLTIRELQPDHPSPKALAAATKFNTAALKLTWLSQNLDNIPSPIAMTAPGQALPGWLAPHLGYLNTGNASIDAESKRLMMQRYGLSPSTTPLNQPPIPTTNPVYTAWSELTTELEKVQPALDTITTLSYQPAFDWNINYADGFSVALPHLAALKNASQWLSAASMHALHHDNQNAALQDLLTQLRLVRKLDHNSLLIGQLVRIATTAIAWDNTWAILQIAGWTDPQLQQLQTAWEQIQTVESTLETLQLERAAALLEYQKCRRSPAYTKEMFEAFLNPTPSEPENFIENALHWLREKAYSSNKLLLRSRWWIWFESYRDELTYLHQSQKLIETLQLRKYLASHNPNPASQLPPNTPWTPAETNDEIPEQYVFANNIDAPFRSTIERAFRIQTQQQLALTAIAIQRYQLTHTNSPPSLATLIPSFLKSPPLDWTAGHPLHYQTTPSNTFLLYACGPDEIDDGGNPTPSKSRQTRFYSFYSGRDLVWPQPKLPPLHTANDFAAGFRLPHKNSDPETFRLQTSPDQPPLWITATTTTPPLSLFPSNITPSQALGFIHVATGYPPNPTQILPAFASGQCQPYEIKARLVAAHLNPDPYPDLALLHPSPLNSRYSHAWLYNPTNQTFTPSPPPSTLTP